MPDRTFDVIVIGAGPAGEVAAGRAADAGLRTALVEDRLVGGECAFWACMPSKALLRPAQALAEVRRVPGAREAVAGNVDAAAALARRDEVVHDLCDDVQLPWLEDHGIELLRGHGRLAGERLVRVGDELLEARTAVVLATGSRPALPPVDGLADAEPWTNREATVTPAVPGRLAVIGGGNVGVELSQAFATLGAQVTLLEVAPQLLIKEEPFAAEQVADALRDAGVDVRTGVTIASVRRAEGTVRIALEDGEPVEADELLVAAGRQPNSDDLGLETIGLEGGSTIVVDERFRVPGHDWLFALGDLNGRTLLTHAGKEQARIAVAIIAGRLPALPRLEGGRAPRVTFCEPQVAAVGYTLQAARDAGLNVVAADADMDRNAGASFHGRGATGTARIVVDRDRDVIVGATFTGVDVAEFLHAATMAIVGELTLDRVALAIPAFPTRSEVWLRLLDVLAEDAG